MEEVADETTELIGARVLDVLIRFDVPLSEVTVARSDMGSEWNGWLLQRILSRSTTTTASIYDLDLEREDCIRAICLPMGDSRWLADMQALLVLRKKQVMTAMLLERAKESVLKGADPEVVLSQLAEVA